MSTDYADCEKRNQRNQRTLITRPHILLISLRNAAFFTAMYLPQMDIHAVAEAVAGICGCFAGPSEDIAGPSVDVAGICGDRHGSSADRRGLSGFSVNDINGVCVTVMRNDP
jgi:hypothetical protein